MVQLFDKQPSMQRVGPTVIAVPLVMLVSCNIINFLISYISLLYTTTTVFEMCQCFIPHPVANLCLRILIIVNVAIESQTC